jgi:hypothetical protein
MSDEANSSQGSNGLYLKCGLIYSLVRQSLMWYGFVSDVFHFIGIVLLGHQELWFVFNQQPLSFSCRSFNLNWSHILAHKALHSNRYYLIGFLL